MKRVVHNSAKLNDADFEFKAVPVDILSAEAPDTDVLVVGPQVEHRMSYIHDIIDPYKIPHIVVDRDTYGKMDGATVMKQALLARKKADLAR